MKNPGFLERLYDGTFDRNIYDLDVNTGPSDRVLRFLDAFDKAVQGYDPRALEAAGTIPAELMARLKSTGVFGLTIPQEFGGLGFSLGEYLRVVQHISGYDMGLVLTPLAHLSIGVKGVLLFGTEAQKKRFLPAAASGEMIFAYALTEPLRGSDAGHVTTRAVPRKDGSYILNGTKTYITNANYAGGFTVFAQIGEEGFGSMGAFVVRRDWEGVSVGPDMPKMGLKASSTASVSFKNVRVPADNLLGEVGDGFKIAMTILNYGRLGLGAGGAGGIQASAKDMAKRAKSRLQFDQPVLQFPLVWEKILVARARGFFAEALTYITAAQLEDSPHRVVAMESSHTKLFATNQAWLTLYDAQQVAGGAGYLATLPYEKRLRDARVTTVFEGTTEIHEMYPPLFLARTWGEVLRKSGGLGRILRFARMAYGGFSGRPRIADTQLSRSLSRGLTILRGVRRDAATLLRKRGSRIAQDEFLLRDLSYRGLEAYMLLAGVRYILALEKGGKDTSEERELIEYYDCLVPESRGALADLHNGRRSTPNFIAKLLKE